MREKEYSFTTRLAFLLAVVTVITIADSYVPQSWIIVRIPFALLQFGFMAATMLMTVRRVLRDY
jgi:hypothetical protein